MKNNIEYWHKNLSRLILSALLVTVIASCSKMDVYKDFTNGGEISYTGKLDSVKILSGRYRVLLKGLFIADPKVTKCVAYWNNMKDSVVIPVTRTAQVDTLSYFIENIEEGVQSFVIYTYDADGNRSIAVNKTGRVFGDRYQGTLSNRGINNAVTSQAGVTAIEWGTMDRLSGVFATEVIYKNNNNADVTIRASIESGSTVLENFKTSSIIKYRTLFLPNDTASVDTFYTAFTDRYIPKFIKEDVTGTYLKNTGRNFSAVASVSRWGVLTDWTTSASVKNVTGSNGGYEKRSDVGYLSLEAGWGLPNVTDGMIYQTMTLPAGTYWYESNDLIQNTGGTRYVVVAQGNTLPLVANTTTNAIAFSSISGLGNAAQHVLPFTLTTSKEVSIGYSATLTGTGSTGMYTKVGSVRLYKIEYQ